MADRSPPLLTQLWQQVHFEMKDALHQAIACMIEVVLVMPKH